MPASLLSLPVELIELIAQRLIFSYCAEDLQSLRCTCKQLSEATFMVRRQAFPRPLPHAQAPTIDEYIKRCRSVHTKILKQIVMVSLVWRPLTRGEAWQLGTCMHRMQNLRLLAVHCSLEGASSLLGFDDEDDIIVDLEIDAGYGSNDHEELARAMISKGCHVRSLILHCNEFTLEERYSDVPDFMRGLIAAPPPNLESLTLDLQSDQGEAYPTRDIDSPAHCLQDLGITGKPLQLPLATYLFEHANTKELLTLRLNSPISDEVASFLASISFPRLCAMEINANRMPGASTPGFNALIWSLPASCAVTVSSSTMSTPSI